MDPDDDGLVLSAHTGGNADVFPHVLRLHVPEGSVVADVTHGKGVFWRNVPDGLYDLRPTDLATGTDCRNLPYADGSIDCVVLDPPYMEGLLRTEGTRAGRGTYAPFRERYCPVGPSDPGRAPPKWHAAVLDLYMGAGAEASRVLRSGGTLITKCQDEVSANRQWLTHVEIVNGYAGFGLRVEDLFVVVRTNRPRVSGMKKQVHARKNHSYFLVFVKQRTSAAFDKPLV
jgi:hypothetical protein